MNRRYIDFVPVKKDESDEAVSATRQVAARQAAARQPREAEVDDFAVAEIFEERKTPAGVTQSRLTADVFKVAKRPLGSVSAKASENSSRTERPAATRVARTNNDVARVRRTETRVVRTEVQMEAPVPEKRAQLGVIEDLGPRFVNTEVEKRPLSAPGSKLANRAEASAEQSSDKTGVKSRKMAERELREAKAEKLTGGKPLRRSSRLSVGEGAMTRAAAQTVRSGESTKSTLGIPKFVNTEKVDKRPLSKNVYAKKAVATKEEPKGPVTIIAKPERDSQVGMVIAIIITIILGATAGTVAFLLLPK